ncbi:MAG: hypothetical protein ACOX7W_08755, partial [Christensenellales bacterium]
VSERSQIQPRRSCPELRHPQRTGTINKIKKKAYRTDKEQNPDGNLKMRADLSEPGGDVNAHI